MGGLLYRSVKGERKRANESNENIQAGYYCTPTGCCKNGRTCTPGSAGGGGSGGGSSGGSGGNNPAPTTTSRTQAPPAVTSSSPSSSGPAPPVQTETGGGRPGVSMPVRPTMSVDDGIDDDDVTSTRTSSSTSTSSRRAAQSTGLSAGGDTTQPGGAGMVSVSVELVVAGVMGAVGFMVPLL